MTDVCEEVSLNMYPCCYATESSRVDFYVTPCMYDEWIQLEKCIREHIWHKLSAAQSICNSFYLCTQAVNWTNHLIQYFNVIFLHFDCDKLMTKQLSSVQTYSVHSITSNKIGLSMWNHYDYLNLHVTVFNHQIIHISNGK